jgi:hypothetical protein
MIMTIVIVILMLLITILLLLLLLTDPTPRVSTPPLSPVYVDRLWRSL